MSAEKFSKTHLAENQTKRLWNYPEKISASPIFFARCQQLEATARSSAFWISLWWFPCLRCLCSILQNYETDCMLQLFIGDFQFISLTSVHSSFSLQFTVLDQLPIYNQLKRLNTWMIFDWLSGELNSLAITDSIKKKAPFKKPFKNRSQNSFAIPIESIPKWHSKWLSLDLTASRKKKPFNIFNFSSLKRLSRIHYWEKIHEKKTVCSTLMHSNKKTSSKKS